MTETNNLESYKNKVILEKYGQTINSLKEENETSVSLSVTQKVAHHASWDNHILTLSTAALGFIYGVLPLSEWSYLGWAIAGSASFVLAIFFAMACFLFADKTFESTSNLQESRSKLIGAMQDDYDMREFVDNLDVSETLNEDGLKNALELNHDAEDARVKFNKICEAELKTINKYSGFATKFNEFKTYTFLIGLILITIFVFTNN